MKKVLYIVICTVLFLGCDREAEVTYGEVVDVKFGVDRTSQLITKADNDFNNVDWSQYDMRYIMEVWNKDGTEVELRKVITVADADTNPVFDFRLIKGRYDFLFWADIVSQGLGTDYNYVTANGLRSVALSSVYRGSDCSRDAFSSVEKAVEIGGSVDEFSTTLYRPFAHVVVKSNNTFLASSNVSVNYSGLCDVYDVRDKKSTLSTTLTDYISFPATVEGSDIIFSDFLLVDDSKKISFQITAGANVLNITDFTIEQNKRSTIYTSL